MPQPNVLLGKESTASEVVTQASAERKCKKIYKVAFKRKNRSAKFAEHLLNHCQWSVIENSCCKAVDAHSVDYDDIAYNKSETKHSSLQFLAFWSLFFEWGGRFSSLGTSLCFLTAAPSNPAAQLWYMGWVD